MLKMVVARELVVVVALLVTCGVQLTRATLNVEVYGNTVMRGTARCVLQLPNGFSQPLANICSGEEAALSPISPGNSSLRITGTMSFTSAVSMWYRYAVQIQPTDWVRLWIDDHRLVDQWGSHNNPTPTTPGLLPNITASSARNVTVRIDIRPWNDKVSFGLYYTSVTGNTNGPVTLVPDSMLVPHVPFAETQRRIVQERAATGWGQWHRQSNLAQIALPHQVGIDLGIKDGATGTIYRYGLLKPQIMSRSGPPTPVRMGRHAYDGTYSHLSFVPFPQGSPGIPLTSSLNVTVKSTVASSNTPATTNGFQVSLPDNFIYVSTNATSNKAAALSANLSLVVYGSSFWGAQANIWSEGMKIYLDVGELGRVTVKFSTKGVNPSDRGVLAEIPITGEPIGISLSFSSSGSTPDTAKIASVLAQAEEKVENEISAAAALAGGGADQIDAYDAMMTAIAWNVNFDPRVAVTAPVSRTFEANFDFIFFDWDMFMLSLMAGTLPAASNPHAYDIAISNLIEVTQTRSAYGQVMNKRAAAGSSSSDTNDRSEPFVGSVIVHRMYIDAQNTPRAATMEWVVEMLYPSLLGWNQWAWNWRRYNSSESDPGLLVLGSDNHLPCEGGTVFTNTSKTHCSSAGAAILESGMDNSPMYYNSFDVPGGQQVGASFDNISNKIQLYDCQHSALFVAESNALKELAAIAGNTTSVPVLVSQSKSIAANIDKILWDDSTGIYRQVDASPMARGFSQAISPTSFYPMIAGIPSVDQVKRMIENHLTNESEFCVDPINSKNRCPFALPSISRSDPNFYDNSYWRGRTWGPLNLLTWIALASPQYAKIPEVAAARKGLVKQSHNLIMVEWKMHRRVHENYNSTTGIGGGVVNSNPFYHWGALLAYIGFREVIEMAQLVI